MNFKQDIEYQLFIGFHDAAFNDEYVEVKELEKSTGVKVILIKDDNIAYKSESLELYHG